MQCPRCSYIRFRSSTKCLNCGFDFKNYKSTSNALGESDNVFTVFTPAVAQDVTVSNAETSVMETPPPPTHERVDTEIGDIAGYDPARELLETNLQDTGDFELDLSQVDNSDSDDWVMGATLMEDLAEISSIAPQDSSKNSGQQTNEFEFQGLGFDTIGDIEDTETDVAHQEKSSSFHTEPPALDEERAIPEMEPYARFVENELARKESEMLHKKDENLDKPPAGVGEKGLKADLEFTDYSTNDSNHGQGIEMEDSQGESREITLETNLEFGKQDTESEIKPEIADIRESSESSIDLKDIPIDLDPTHELEDLHLDLETKSPEVESPQDYSLQVPDLQSFLGNRSPKTNDDENNPHSPEENPKPDH